MRRNGWRGMEVSRFGAGRFARGGIERLWKDGEGEGGAGGAGPAFLPEELRADPALKDFKDAGSLAKSYKEMVAYRGQSIRVPTKDAGDQVRQEFLTTLRERVPELVPRSDEASLWAALGRPKEATEYAPPEGVALAEEALAALRKEAGEEGLTRSQFAARAKRLASALQERDQAATQAVADLKAEWGAAYDERLAQVRGVLDTLQAPQALRDAAAKGQIDKATANMLFRAAKTLGTQPREVGRQGGTGGAAGSLTPAEAQAKVKELMRNPLFNNPGQDPDEYRRLVGEYTRLQPLAYPELAGQEE